MANSKFSLDALENFSMLTINNKYAKNMPILWSLLRVSVGNINVLTYFSYLRIKNLNSNNESDRSKTEERIKLKNKMS